MDTALAIKRGAIIVWDSTQKHSREKMRAKKTSIVPAPLSRLGEDIKNMVKTNEGLLLATEIIDEIPKDLRPHVIDGLASFGTEIANFLHVLKEEYGKEINGLQPGAGEAADEGFVGPPVGGEKVLEHGHEPGIPAGYA